MGLDSHDQLEYNIVALNQTIRLPCGVGWAGPLPCCHSTAKSVDIHVVLL
jgi:hypothetical protein